MFDVAQISAQLEALAEADVARRQGRHLRPLRGLRGVPTAEVARVLVEAWSAGPFELAEVEQPLRGLFSTAFEDGLVALGLAAAALPDAPEAALELSRSWGEVVDDIQTADALGWLLVGPGLLATLGDGAGERLAGLRKAEPMRRRVAVSACLAALPLPVEGPSAAALRHRLGVKHVVFVEAPLVSVLDPVIRAFHRDEDARVRKVASRALRTWAVEQPNDAEDFVDSIRGGISKQLRAELDLGLKRGRRRAARQMDEVDEVDEVDDLDDLDGLDAGEE